MIGNFEKYHGIALRAIIVSAPNTIGIATNDYMGRLNSYLLNGTTAILIKHSAKRLPPWQFTFTAEQIEELTQLHDDANTAWLLLVCGMDGIVALSHAEFWQVVGAVPTSTPFIRIDRDRRTMYRVFGNAGKLSAAKANGVAAVILDACSHDNPYGSLA